MKLTAEQDAAIRARGNVLVAAGAGTGKTRTLVERCMALLESGASLERMLLVTFTEAAAAEMRSRIRSALLERLETALTRPGVAGSPSPIGLAALSRRRSGWEREGVREEGAQHPTSNIEHPTSNPASSRRRLQADDLQRELTLLETAHISTLHSFCLQLVREHFHELGIDPEIAVMDETQARPLIEQLLTAHFERHLAGDTPHDRAVQRLVREYGRGSDETLRKHVIRLHRYTQSLANPEEWFNEQERRFSRPDAELWRNWYVEGVLEWRAFWRPLLEPLSDITAIALACRALDLLGTYPSAEQVGAVLAEVQSAADVRSNWPRGSKKRTAKQLDWFFKELDFLLSLAPGANTNAISEDWERVRQPMLAFLKLTREFTQDFTRTKRELGAADFADLEQMALRVLHEPGSDALSAVALQWQGLFDYVFVDEYQDINAAQDAILRAISRDGAEANRFLVGDVKQSIYRFRLANPTIFRAYEEDWKNAAHCQRLALLGNFRSRRGILDFVNAFFGIVMRESIGGFQYEPLAPGVAEPQQSNAAPRVEIHLLASGKNEVVETNGEPLEAELAELADLMTTEREARLVAMRLRELKNSGHCIRDPIDDRLRPIEWRDMVVLLRSPKGRVEAFAQEFARCDVPIEAARGGFFASSEVSDLVCLLKLLDNALQDIPLLAVLRSPLAGLSLNELAQVRAGAGVEFQSAHFWKAAQRYHETGDRTHSAWRKLDQFYARLERWREVLRHSSVAHCLEIVLSETCYEVLLRAQPRGEQRAANVRRLLALARQYDPYQRQGLFRFLRFIAAQEEEDLDIAASPTGHNTVTLMSIHKSKGLEFPLVVVAGLGSRFNTSDLYAALLLDEKYGLCSKVIGPAGEWHYPSPPQWLARRRQQRELLAEEARVLYVAMTRARDTLLLTGTARKDPVWEPEWGRSIDDRELLSALSHLDWLRAWLPTVTQQQHWTNECEGATPLFTWRIWNETDPRLLRPSGAQQTSGADAIPPNERLSPALWERVSWKYQFQAATRQRAKTSVTDIRRRHQEEEVSPAPFLRRREFSFPDRTPQKLSAAESGLANHHFLERVSLAAVSNPELLPREVERLKQEGWLNDAEASALDLQAITAFWKSGLGKSFLEHPNAIQRELEFTSRFTPEEVRLNGGDAAGVSEDEDLIIVQGVADLAAILPKEIWLVDFKTDAVTAADVDQKAETYGPQLRLYALALSRIYKRPVTRCALYFLKPRLLREGLMERHRNP